MLVSRRSILILYAGSALAACGGDESRRASMPKDAGQAGVVVSAGARARATLEPLAAVDAGAPARPRAVATFTATDSGVSLQIMVRDCERNRLYPIHIHAGTSCASGALHGGHWDAPRGEGIPDVNCISSGGGAQYYVRASNDPKPWSIDDGAASDIVGHVMVLHDPESQQPIACGKIEVERAGAAQALDAGTDSGVRAELRAQLAGLCIAEKLTPMPVPGCPDPERYAACASMHCELASCEQECGDYLACLSGEADPCSSQCIMSEGCANCSNRLFRCAFGFCRDELACAPPPTPGGPCSQVEECCARQGDRAESCLDLLRIAEQLSGEVSCVGLMHDWDFLTNFAYDPPCMF